MEVTVSIEKVLGDGTVGAGIRLRQKMLHIRAQIGCLRMTLRVGSNLDVEVITMLLANEAHQVGCIRQLTLASAHARWQVAA